LKKKRGKPLPFKKRERRIRVSARKRGGQAIPVPRSIKVETEKISEIKEHLR